jgi:hypothetical protein
MSNYPNITDAANTYLNTADESHLVKTETTLALVKFIDELYNRIPVKVDFVKDDPYTNIDDLRADIANTQSFKVWGGACSHPLWGRLTNCKLRAVHDYFDHYIEGERINIVGEWKSYCNMLHRWFDWCLTNSDLETLEQGSRVLRSEMWLQPATATNLGGYEAMPEQKIVLS